MKSILNSFKIDTSAYILMLIYILCGYIKSILLIYFIIIVHEIGHVLIALLFKRKITSITIYSFGGVTKSSSMINSSLNEDLLIYISGIIFQIVLGLLINFIKPFTPLTMSLFNHYNNIIILFNLIPIIPLDGYLILNNLMNKFIPFYYSLYISLIISLVSILIFIILWKENIMIIVFLLYNAIIYNKNIKIIHNKFMLERYLYRINKKKNKYFNKINLNNLLKEQDCYFRGKNGYINESDILAKKFDKR